MHTPHDRIDDFAAQADTLRQLRDSDLHFRTLTERYAELNEAVHRAETRLDTVSEAEEHRLRQERASLKDQIAAALDSADPAAAGA